MWRSTTFLLALALVSEVFVYGYDGDYELSPQIVEKDSSEPERYGVTSSDEEYIRHIHSLFDSYRGERPGAQGGGRLVVETDALIDTKYRTWKRNADLINSILALPKGMNDAGR